MNWLVLAGSVAGVIGLAVIARMLRLGGVAISGEAEARAFAELNHVGFEAEEAFVSADGASALVRGRDGSFVLLKAHGAQMASRRAMAPLRIEATGEGVRIATGERMFGPVPLQLPPEARDKLMALV